MRNRRNQRFVRRRREHNINSEIQAPYVRLITDEGSQEIPTEQALELASQQELDLVEVAKNEKMPIVKIIDYGKFKFEQNKKKKENQKKQKTVQVKEVKLGPKTDVDDFTRKCREAKNFLEKGNNVKVSMRFRGREMAHTNIGREKMTEFVKNIEEFAIVDQKPMLQGRVMHMALRPKVVIKKNPTQATTESSPVKEIPQEKSSL